MSEPTPAPTPTPKPVVSTPAIKQVILDKSKWYLQPTNAKSPVVIQNTCISNGGLLLLNGETSPDQIVTLTNVYNTVGSPNGGVYFVMLWPEVNKDGSQTAIPKLIWNNSQISNPVVQGSAECAFRAKCDDAQITGVTFKGFLQENGQPYKQVVELRHGKSFTFTDCTFLDSWPDIGQQQIEGQGYDKTQHIGIVNFINCRFTRYPSANEFVHRDPGVDKIVYANCVSPDNKTFSKTE